MPQDANPKLVEWMTALCTSENPVFSGLMSTASVAVCQAFGLPPTAGIDEILELADDDLEKLTAADFIIDVQQQGTWRAEGTQQVDALIGETKAKDAELTRWRERAEGEEAAKLQLQAQLDQLAAERGARAPNGSREGRARYGDDERQQEVLEAVLRHIDAEGASHTDEPRRRHRAVE